MQKKLIDAQKPRQQTLVLFNDTLILKKSASIAVQQYGLYHKKMQLPT
jgi:hypothetical protein